MNRKHASSYYDETDDAGFLLLESRFMRAIDRQNSKRIGRTPRNRFADQDWRERFQDTYRDRS